MALTQDQCRIVCTCPRAAVECMRARCSLGSSCWAREANTCSAMQQEIWTVLVPVVCFRSTLNMCSMHRSHLCSVCPLFLLLLDLLQLSLLGTAQLPFSGGIPQDASIGSFWLWQQYECITIVCHPAQSVIVSYAWRHNLKKEQPPCLITR